MCKTIAYCLHPPNIQLSHIKSRGLESTIMCNAKPTLDNPLVVICYSTLYVDKQCMYCANDWGA